MQEQWGQSDILIIVLWILHALLYVDVTGMSSDVDLYVYNDSLFSLLNTSPGNPGTTIGTASELLNIYPYNGGNLYIEVRPMAGSATYSILVH